MRLGPGVGRGLTAGFEDGGKPARDPSRDSGIRNSQYARLDAFELSLSRADSAKQPAAVGQTGSGPQGRRGADSSRCNERVLIFKTPQNHL